MSSPAEKPAQKKTSAPPAHPSYKNMIIAAVIALKDRKGASRQAIVKYITANYKVRDNAGKLVKNQLKKGVASGVFEKAESGFRFKLSEATKTAAKKPASKKTTAAKPKAKAVKPKKPAAKTTKKKTKPSPKKSTKSPAGKPKKSPAKSKTKKASTGKATTKKAGTKPKKATPKKSIKKPAAKKTKAQK